MYTNYVKFVWKREDEIRSGSYYNDHASYFRDYFVRMIGTDQPLKGIKIDWEKDLAQPDVREFDRELWNFAQPHLQALEVLDQTDPLFMI